MKRIYIPISNLEKRAEQKEHILKAKLTSKKVVNPLNASLKMYCPSVYDQGDIGSCTANAICSAYQIIQKSKNLKDTDFQPSRLFIYYQTRLIENNNDSEELTDSGANVIHGAHYLISNGICSEKLWPYDITKYNMTPPSECYIDAENHRAKNYVVIPNNRQLIYNIESSIVNGSPVMCAIAVYDSFESSNTAKTGVVTMPTKDESLLGGHEMCIIGYTRTKELFTVLNSWGDDWGDKGFCYIPYNYFTNRKLGYQFTVFSF